MRVQAGELREATMEPLVVSLGPVTLQAWGLFMLLALGDRRRALLVGCHPLPPPPREGDVALPRRAGRRRPRRQAQHDRLPRAAGVLLEPAGVGPHRHGLHGALTRRIPRRTAHGALLRHELPLRSLRPAHSAHAGNRPARQLLRRRCLRHPDRSPLGCQPGRRYASPRAALRSRARSRPVRACCYGCAAGSRIGTISFASTSSAMR